jgi:hypothetical protein
MQEMQECQQHYILHGDTAEGAEKHGAGKLKRVSGEYETYRKDGNARGRRTNQLKACAYHSGQRRFGDDESNSNNWRPEER